YGGVLGTSYAVFLGQFLRFSLQNLELPLSLALAAARNNGANIIANHSNTGLDRIIRLSKVDIALAQHDFA
ncbi:MAG: hypothetical protein CMP47_11365, partial [Rickettsiales bacterium]|nr:hypothetical protein [Rickettsiales bacterium]